MTMKNIFFILILILPIISYISFPLKKEKISSQPDINNPKEIFSSFLDSRLYINLNIGSNKIDIKAFLIQSKTELIIAGKNINHKYDETQSSTYNMTNKNKVSFQFGMYSEGILSKDNFNILNNNDELNNYNIDFILGTKGSSAYIDIKEAQVGLHLPLLQSYSEFNLIRSLKNNNVTTSYNWYLDFDDFNSNEGKMIVDGFPHDLNNKKYFDENFVKSNAIDRHYAVLWGLKFSSINYGNQNLALGLDLRAHFGFDYGIISASKEAGELFESLFFEKYISKNICFKEKVGVYGNYFFYCKKNDEFNIQNFDSIYFNCPDLDITFELDYKDLFYIDNDNIYFLIEFSKNTKIWNFGEIFLRKYYIVFNQDEKTLGYYKNMEKPKKDKDKNENMMKNNTSWYNSLIIILVIIILAICVISMGVYIYKNKKNRKKKANELDDEYNYEPKFDLNYDNNNNLIGDDKIIN